VAVLPVINNNENPDLTWDISTELTDEIRNRIYDSKKIYLLREGGNREMAQLLSTPNIKAISKNVTESLGAAQFVVVSEIIEQDEEKYGLGPGDHPFRSEVGAILSLALRVRVIDLRNEKPKVILQEILDNDFVISRAYMNCDYKKMPWGTEAFTRTPMGIAHNRLIRTLVSRIESYIEAAQ
jgi:hypothetical protein